MGREAVGEHWTYSMNQRYKPLNKGGITWGTGPQPSSMVPEHTKDCGMGLG
jgi:hypothetical protein